MLALGGQTRAAFPLINSIRLCEKLEFIAKITTSDGREITKRVEEEIPEGLNLENLDEFMSTFDDYERHALKARNGICEEITQAWLEQAKKGA